MRFDAQGAFACQRATQREPMVTVSKFDEEPGPLARAYINDLLQNTAKDLSVLRGMLLEIGPQERSFLRESFCNFDIDTFDIATTYGHVGDITKHDTTIPNATRSRDCHEGSGTHARSIWRCS